MSADARFEDADEAPLRLVARDSDDLRIVSSLVQDAVFPASEIAWDRGKRQLAVLLNRFRWESRDRSAPERVQSVMVVNEVAQVASQGFVRGDPDLVLSVLAVEHSADAPDTQDDSGRGTVLVTLAGDGAVRCRVARLEVTLTDVTRPYGAPSGHRPAHPD